MRTSRVTQQEGMALAHYGFKLRLLTLIAVLILITGCGAVVANSAIRMAHRIDAKDAKKQYKQGVSFAEKEKARFEKMKAEGDPDGYYFSAIAFAHSKRDYQPEDVAEIKRRYEEAVQKGSNDAKIALGNMLVNGHTVPFEYQNGALPMDQREIKRGLRLMSEGATKSCFLKQPLFPDSKCGNIRMFNSTLRIWVAHRDGVYSRNHASEPWVQLVPKNEQLAGKWKKRFDQCEIEVKQYKAQNGCSTW